LDDINSSVVFVIKYFIVYGFANKWFGRSESFVYILATQRTGFLRRYVFHKVILNNNYERRQV